MVAQKTYFYYEVIVTTSLKCCIVYRVQASVENTELWGNKCSIPFLWWRTVSFKHVSLTLIISLDLRINLYQSALHRLRSLYLPKFSTNISVSLPIGFAKPLIQIRRLNQHETSLLGLQIDRLTPALALQIQESYGRSFLAHTAFP